ncbi:MAG: hypothetical protein C4532_05890 [Candidatus Abyssobacteria bacterium SURF_17]|uniref:Peptidase C45 hydrolase domain-containing protein n=1 Tax=Candidatus Abyssobacteria bacterium SURF_17 TaxID=2093361 RepID=A0A419F2E9_9BACT|nr:MAG: hypothetical protein C4532_05890 [Candidatus Abyssubacteria bacterium SURF_17]
MLSLILFLVVVLLLGTVALIVWPILGHGSEYVPNSEEIRWLRSTSVVQDEKGRKAFGRATLERRGGLNVLKLFGSHYEMGYQHGALLRDEIQRGAVPFYGRPTENLAPFKHMNKVMRVLLAKYFDWKIYRPLLKCSPRQYLAEVKGLADGSGLSFADVFRGNMLSDLNMNLIKVLEKKALKQGGTDGCTSFAAFGNATVDGSLIMGRNTDYTGGGLWDRYQTVVFYEPEDGHKFVSVSSAGLIKCNSCMNEKGICLGAHFLFLDDTKADGVSFTFLEMEIMKKAGSVEDAIAVVSQNPRAGAFAFLIVDGKANEAAVIEASANHVGVRRPEDGVIWETNMATTEPILSADVLLRNGIGKNPIARFERMRMLIHENKGKITPELAAQFMGDHMDMCSDSLRPAGGIISQVSNLTSVVFRPSNFDFWVADGLSPVCNNAYRGFNLMEELADGYGTAKPTMLEPNEYVKTPDYTALRKYYEAMVSFTVPPTDENAALAHLEEAIALRPQEALYRRLTARMLLRRARAADAAEHLRRALECVQSPSERAQAHLLLGFANDLLGRRNDAVQCYQDALNVPSSGKNGVLSAVNPFVLADAKRFAQAAFSSDDAKKIEVSFEIIAKHDL